MEPLLQNLLAAPAWPEVQLPVAPTMPVGWTFVPALLTFLVMLGRVYVGAHNPLDVTAGLGAGLLLGCIVAMFVD